MENSEKIRLEPIGYQHAEEIQNLASDPAIGETSSVPSPYPSDGARTWIAHAIARRLHGMEYSFAISSEGRLVGVCGVVIIGENRKGGEIGYWIGKPFWNRGYATAACSEIIEFCFLKMKLSWLTATALERNSASSRVLQKVGFSFVARGVNPSWKKGSEDPFLFFRLTREDWLQIYTRGPDLQQQELQPPA
jgi:ribosomal-protein-alanine N-acetyltransferase